MALTQESNQHMQLPTLYNESLGEPTTNFKRTENPRGAHFCHGPIADIGDTSHVWGHYNLHQAPFNFCTYWFVLYINACCRREWFHFCKTNIELKYSSLKHTHAFTGMISYELKYELHVQTWSQMFSDLDRNGIPDSIPPAQTHTSKPEFVRHISSPFDTTGIAYAFQHGPRWIKNLDNKVVFIICNVTLLHCVDLHHLKASPM